MKLRRKGSRLKSHHSASLLLAAAFVMAASACGPSKAAVLTANAAADLSCAPEQLQITSKAMYVESVSGCGRENIYLYGHKASAWVSPIATASTQLACEPANLNVTAIREKSVQIGGGIGHVYVAEVSGCGRKSVHLSNMATGSWVSPLERAAFDLSCKAGELTSELLDEHTAGVQGCGQKGTYVIVVAADGAKWVLDSTSQSDK